MGPHRNVLQGFPTAMVLLRRTFFIRHYTAMKFLSRILESAVSQVYISYWMDTTNKDSYSEWGMVAFLLANNTLSACVTYAISHCIFCIAKGCLWSTLINCGRYIMSNMILGSAKSMMRCTLQWKLPVTKNACFSTQLICLAVLQGHTATHSQPVVASPAGDSCHETGI